MNLRIATHSAVRRNANVVVCAWCAMTLPEPPTVNDMIRSVFDGERIAVIETKCIPPRSYRVGENDSNIPCNQEAQVPEAA